MYGYNTPLGAFPLLCFWLTVWSCEVLTRQNQSVSNAFYVYMSSRLSPYRAFSIAKFSIQPCQYIMHWHRVRRCKCNTLFWNSKESIILFKIIGVIIPNRSLEKVSCHFLMTDLGLCRQHCNANKWDGLRENDPHRASTASNALPAVRQCAWFSGCLKKQKDSTPRTIHPSICAQALSLQQG